MLSINEINILEDRNKQLKEELSVMTQECEKLKTDWQEMFERRNKLNSKVLELSNKLEIATIALERTHKTFKRFKYSMDELDIHSANNVVINALERIKE